MVAENFLNVRRGLGSWFYTLDHKRIGIMYLISILIFFIVGGLFALMLRLELWNPAKTLLEAKQYNQLFTLHGSIMIFLVIIPSIPASLGNFALPLLLGAKDVAFPKLNLTSYYFYIIGAVFVLASIVLGAIDTGWTFYTPYSLGAEGKVILMGTAVFILGFSSIFTGLNFIVTVHKLRVNGMTWFKIPLFVWGIYATAVIQVLATPILGITLLLLIVERVIGIGIFEPALGGDPVLFQHFFWFYSHPAVYVMILPAMAIISELISTFSQKKIFGYKVIAISSITIAALSFLVWGHHMYVSGQSELAGMIFSVLTLMVTIPSAIKVFNWLATMYEGCISLKTPMIWALNFVGLFTIGGLTGIFLALLSVNVQLHDTYFVVAHFHYTMFGGTMMALIGGIYYWWPKMTGKMYSEKWGRIAAIIVFLGFNLTFFIQFFMGAQGLPRRYYNYLEQFQPYQRVATVGSWLLAVGLFMVLFNLIHSLRKGAKAPDNPWNASTLDFTNTSSPPIEHNFENHLIVKNEPYNYVNKEVTSV